MIHYGSVIHRPVCLEEQQIYAQKPGPSDWSRHNASNMTQPSVLSHSALLSVMRLKTPAGLSRILKPGH